jgi:hypothetical protein
VSLLEYLGATEREEGEREKVGFKKFWQRK